MYYSESYLLSWTRLRLLSKICLLIILKVQFDDVRAWIILSKIRINLSLFQNLISTEDLSVKIDCCSDCYKQNLD